MDEKIKLRVIVYIDYLKEKYGEMTPWRIEINSMRSKYIFKDISIAELQRDIKWLKNIKNIVNDYYYAEELKKQK